MCGICGFSGHANDGLLDQMGNAIRHRGPDGLGCYSDGRMNQAAFHRGSRLWRSAG